jgi:hypothetical protein
VLFLAVTDDGEVEERRVQVFELQNESVLLLYCSLHLSLEVLPVFNRNRVHIHHLNALPRTFSHLQSPIFILGVAIVHLFFHCHSSSHSHLKFPEFLSECPKHLVNEVASKRKLAFISIKQFLLAGKGGADVEDSQVHAF